MASVAVPGKVYSATYSNTPIYECVVGDNHVMRRRADNWINATHILKVANLDKPTRTRVLEREVQKGVHEKVQGGYGKYQGTWIPLPEGRFFAEKYQVYEQLKAIFEFVPGDKSPPPAPKHTTAASNKPKNPKAAPVKRVSKTKPAPAPSQMSEEQYDNISAQLNDDESLENSTLYSESMVDEDDMMQRSQNSGTGRKRKRCPEPAQDAQDAEDEERHQYYTNELLDYFMLQSAEDKVVIPSIPTPPERFQVNRIIDNQNHTGLHWSAAMGDLNIVKDYLNRGANPKARNIRGETPLIRAILFTNNYQKKALEAILHLLQTTLTTSDNTGGTVFHHVCYTTDSHSKKKCAHHYLRILLNKLAEAYTQQEFHHVLNRQDHNGDTALHIAARYKAKKCILAFQGAGVAGDIPNSSNVTADQLLQELGIHSRDRYPVTSSSPMQPSLSNPNGLDSTRGPHDSMISNGSSYRAQSANSFNHSFPPLVTNMSMQLTQELENEVQESETDLGERRRLLQNVSTERHQARQTTYEVISREGRNDDEGQMSLFGVETSARATGNESSLEQEQHKSLHGITRAEEQTMSNSANHRKVNGASSSDEEFKQRMNGSLTLETLQGDRMDLISTVVQAQASAGMSEKGEAYTRLVASAIDVPSDEVPETVSEVLEELEMSKMDQGMTSMYGGQLIAAAV